MTNTSDNLASTPREQPKAYAQDIQRPRHHTPAGGAAVAGGLSSRPNSPSQSAVTSNHKEYGREQVRLSVRQSTTIGLALPHHTGRAVTR